MVRISTAIVLVQQGHLSSHPIQWWIKLFPGSTYGLSCKGNWNLQTNRMKSRVVSRVPGGVRQPKPRRNIASWWSNKRAVWLSCVPDSISYCCPGLNWVFKMGLSLKSRLPSCIWCLYVALSPMCGTGVGLCTPSQKWFRIALTCYKVI